MVYVATSTTHVPRASKFRSAWPLLASSSELELGELDLEGVLLL